MGVTDDPIPGGETPEDGDAFISSNSFVRRSDKSIGTLTDRLDPGEYTVFNELENQPEEDS